MDRNIVSELYQSNKHLNEKLDNTKIEMIKRIEELKSNQVMIFNTLTNILKQNESIISMLRISQDNKEFTDNMIEIDKNIAKFKKINIDEQDSLKSSISSKEEELIKL